MIVETLPLTISLIQSGIVPMPAIAAIRQMTVSRSSHVASVSFRCASLRQVP